MKSDAGFVEDVEHTHKGRAYLCGKANSLRLASRKGSRLAGKRPEIVGELLFDGGSLLKEALVDAADNADEIVRLFSGSGLEAAAEKGTAMFEGGSMTEFELAVDNSIKAYLADAVRIGFGPAAVISYLAAVENEVMTLRII